MMTTDEKASSKRMDEVKSVSLLHLLCFWVLFSIGSALSTDKTPVFWPYEDGTVQINSLNFQKVLDSQTKFQHIVWHKCIAKCTSTDQHQWLRIARMNFKGSIFIENFTDSNLYGLDARGILRIKKQTVHNNGTEYRIDIRKWGVESEFFKLLHFKDEQAVDGGWSSWSEWTDCSVSCGGGVQNQSRTCTNPPPSFGGKLCPGLHAETRECNGNHCPVDGNWSNWLDWTDCSLTCSTGGFQNRSRACSNPAPEFGGNLCLGPSTETRPCFGNPCPVDGNWSPWYYWSECSTSCGGGVQRRARFCTNPPAAFGGKPCAGESLESRGCNSTPCSDLQKYLPLMVGLIILAVWVIWLLRQYLLNIISQLCTAAPVEAALAQVVPAQDVPVQAVPAQDVPAKDVPAQAVRAQAVPAQDVPAQAVPAQDVPAQDVPAQAVRAEAQINASRGGEMHRVCYIQGNGRGNNMSQIELLPYGVPEMDGEPPCYSTAL